MYKNGIPKTHKFVNNAPNQPSKFRKRNWVEINDESRGTYTSNSIKYITTMLTSNLCDYADAYILVKGTITTTGDRGDDAVKRLDERNKGVIFKNCAPFTKCICRINNTEIDTDRDIDIVMPMYNLNEVEPVLTNLRYFFCKWRNKIYYNRNKIICSSCNFINTR